MTPPDDDNTCLLHGKLDPTYGGCYECDREREADREEGEKYGSLLGGARAWEQYKWERFKVTPGNEAMVAKVKAWAPTKGNLYIHGPTGTGKTHLAIAAARAWFKKMPLYTLKPAQLAREVRGTRSAVGEAEIMERYIKAGVLVLDDIGVAKDTEFSTALLYELIDGRYMNKPGGLIVTSNLSLDDLAAKLGDDRIPSRLAQMCRGGIINMTGQPDRRVQP